MAMILGATHMGPWTRPLNWNLHVTSIGEPQTPFSLYVLPELTSPSCAAFLPFCRLPTELQLRVLYFCDSPTLFQLMQVSSVTRTEAKRLFWLYPDAWYHVDGDWLLAGGFPGHAHHASDVQAHVERVEADFAYADSLCRD